MLAIEIIYLLRIAFSQMWQFLEQTSLLLDGLFKALIDLPKSRIALAKKILTCQSIQMSGNKQGIRKQIPKSTASDLLSHVIDENGELIPGLLTYLMDGVLPMLKVCKICNSVLFYRILNFIDIFC